MVSKNLFSVAEQLSMKEINEDPQRFMLRETILRHKRSLTGITKSESQLFYSMQDRYSDSESENNNKSKGEGFPEIL